MRATASGPAECARCGARAQAYVQEGRSFVVDIELEKFFYRVNHDILMGRLTGRIADRWVLRLIRRYLNAGVLANGVVIERDAEIGPQPMKRIGLVALIAIFQIGFAALAEEHGRIKKKPPSPVEVERIASDMVMNDGSLHKGDTVSTDRAFFLYRGLGPDGYTNNFVRVPTTPLAHTPRPSTFGRVSPALFKMHVPLRKQSQL